MKREKRKFDAFFKTKTPKKQTRKRKLQGAEFNEDLETFFPCQSKEEEKVVSRMG